MKILTILATILCLITANAQACVTYNPSKGTYTVNPQGYADKGQKIKPEKPKEKQKQIKN